VVRDFADPEAAKAFLRPSLSALHPPEALTDLPRGCDRILRAVREGETIFVHGDYDVDGMAGTTLLTLWIRRLGGKVVPFLPHRLRDGYDLGPAGLAASAESGAALIVTVDCGILAHEAIREAKERGMDVIITDHHAPGRTLPPAVAVLNPNRDGSSYPNKGLSGAGVAFKLCQGLGEAFGVPAEDLHPFLDLVALATVADLVPLTGENRVLARFGLRALSETRNLGLQALMTEAGLQRDQITAGNIGFGLAPRLNAMGRLGDPRAALRLLLADSPEEGRTLAREAEELNRRRQETDARTLEEALDQLSRTFDPSRDFGLVLDSEGWHPGVIGIVASRVVERLHRPTVMVATDGSRGRGSARSIPGFDLLDAIRACGEHLERYGGHRQAAGMELARSRLPGFRDAFNREARVRLEGTELRPVLTVDLEVRLEELSEELHRFLRHLGPHGIGNPRPLFLLRGVILRGRTRLVGAGHLKARIRQGASELDAIGFRLGHRIHPEELGPGPFDALVQLGENEYRGVRTLQAHLKDIRPSESPVTGTGP
jgi:single-stranded-DNA-specific exonuclease